MDNKRQWEEFLYSFEEAFENIDLRTLDKLIEELVENYLWEAVAENILKESLRLVENYIHLQVEAGVFFCQGLAKFFRLVLERCYWQLDYVENFIREIYEDIGLIGNSSCLINYSLIYFLLDYERQDAPRQALENLDYRKLKGQELRDFFYLSLFYDLEEVDSDFFKGRLEKESLELGRVYRQAKDSQDFSSLSKAFRNFKSKLSPRFLDRLKENILYRQEGRIEKVLYEINNQIQSCPCHGEKLEAGRARLIYSSMGQVKGLVDLDVLLSKGCDKVFIRRKDLSQLDPKIQIFKSSSYYDDLYDYKAKKIPEINLSDYD